MNKKTKKSGLREKIDLESIAEDVSTLMDMRLTKQQALSTLALFPHIDDAMKVAESYHSLPLNERPVSFTCYNDFLESLTTAIYGSEVVRSLYEEEVADRTLKVSEESLAQIEYRDNPLDYEHRYEHDITKGQDLSDNRDK